MIKCLKVSQRSTRTIIYVQIGGCYRSRERFRSASRKDQIVVRNIPDCLSCTVKVNGALTRCKCTRSIGGGTTDI